MTPNAPDLDGYRRALQRLALPRFAAKGPSRPFLVALEGPNGAGKSTLCRLMAKGLEADYCLGTDEAWFSEFFRARMIRDADWYTAAMFFLSGCFEQMRMLRRRPEGLFIMDRSLWSTFAVHAAASTERLEALIGMVRPIATEVQGPHLTVVLEASFSTCQSRIAMKNPEARGLDELTATEISHAREREFYRWLAGQIPNVIFLDVDDDKPEEVARKAIAAFRTHRC